MIEETVQQAQSRGKDIVVQDSGNINNGHTLWSQHHKQ